MTKCCQHSEGGDPSLLLSTGKTSSRGLCPVLGSSEQEEHGHNWKKSSKRLQRWWKDCSFSPMSKDSELGLHCLNKRRLRGILLMYTNTCREGTKKTEQVSFCRCPVAEAEEGAQTETLEVSSVCQETLLYRWSVSTAQVTQSGSRLSPWRHWNSTWTWSWSARSRSPFLNTRGCTSWPEGFLSTLTNFVIGADRH